MVPERFCGRRMCCVSTSLNWAKFHRLVLDELGARGELDWSRCAIDSVNVRALERGTRQVRILWTGEASARRSI